MTLQEFKAWFDGFTENMGEAPPTKLQWARIQARVKEIDGAAVTYPVFFDRYWPHPSPTTWPNWVTFTTGSSFPVSNTFGTVGYNAPNMNTLNDGHAVFNATAAMTSLGQADYAAVQ
jgi:hypothetical protein